MWLRCRFLCNPTREDFQDSAGFSSAFLCQVIWSARIDIIFQHYWCQVIQILFHTVVDLLVISEMAVGVRFV